VAWLSVDRSDGRPARFWGKLLKLIRAATGSGVDELPDPAEVGDFEFVTALSDAVGQLSPPLIVVLDDFEQLHSRSHPEPGQRRRRRGATWFVERAL
jgi:ATP/maltotriose-dependent transcriptional regulator MalT